MADQLSEQHRLAQVRLGALTAKHVVEVWPLLDPNRLDATFERWLLAVSPIIAANRLVSSRLAANYLAAHRANALGVEVPPAPPITTAPLDPRRLRTSLLVTGPISIKQAMTRGVPVDDAVRTAQANTARASLRHALNGGRELILATVAADPRSTGYERTTSGAACPECQGLAGIRSADAETVSFVAHDGCSCSAAPVYQ